MISENPIGIIELGNVKIKCIIFKVNEEGKVEILSGSINDSYGIHNSVIVNLTKASDAIRLCISNAEKKAQISLKKINVVIEQPEFLCTKLSKDRKINGAKVHKHDIEFLLKEAKKEVMLNDATQSIIHIFNHNYIVDGKTFIEEPIDVFADYLSHEMTFISMPKNNIKNINQAFNNCDIEVERIVSCTFALGVELLNNEDLSSGSVLIDLGFEKLSLGLYKNLALVHSLTLPIGVNHIAKDIAKVCSLSLEESNSIVKKFDFSFQHNDSFFDEKDFLKESYFVQSNFRKISKPLILKVINARVDEILKIVEKQILVAKFGKSFGSKIFIVGGGSMLTNIEIYCSNFFNLEVKKLQKEKNLNGEKDPNFDACFGAIKLIKDGWETEALPDKKGKNNEKKGFFAKFFGN